MKRHIFAFTTGAALVASLLVGSAGSAQANTDTNEPHAQAAQVSKAATPKDINGQVELAVEQGHVNQAPAAEAVDGQIALAAAPSNLSKADKAKDINGQVELASEPGHTSTEVDTK